jgi:hypothetical protein
MKLNSKFFWLILLNVTAMVAMTTVLSNNPMMINVKGEVTSVIVSATDEATRTEVVSTIEENNGVIRMVATIEPINATNKTINWTVVDGTGSASNIVLAGVARPEHIFWLSATTATIGANSHFQGIIIASTSIAVGAGVVVDGRLFAQTRVDLGVGSTISAPNESTNQSLRLHKRY